MTVLQAPLPPTRMMSVMERYDKERTAAFGALTDAIEAVADKITDAQYKAIYDAAMVIYQRSTPPEGVRAMVLDAESLNQVASVAAEAAVAASDRRERDATTIGDVRARAFNQRESDATVVGLDEHDRPVTAGELRASRDAHARVREYERDAVNAMQAARSPDPVEAEWGAMWMDQVDEGYGGPHISRPRAGGNAIFGPRMRGRAVQQVARAPNARDVLAYYRMAALVRPAHRVAPRPSSGDALADHARYMRHNEPPPPLIEYPGDGSHTLPPLSLGEDEDEDVPDDDIPYVD